MKSGVTSKAGVGKSRDIFTIQAVKMLIESPVMGPVLSLISPSPLWKYNSTHRRRRPAFNLRVEGIQGDRKGARGFFQVTRR